MLKGKQGWCHKSILRLAQIRFYFWQAHTVVEVHRAAAVALLVRVNRTTAAAVQRQSATCTSTAYIIYLVQQAVFDILRNTIKM